MAGCGSCGKAPCTCAIQEGTGVTITGSGTPADPWVINSSGGGGGGGGLTFSDGLGDTFHADTLILDPVHSQTAYFQNPSSGVAEIFIPEVFPYLMEIDPRDNAPVSRGTIAVKDTTSGPLRVIAPGYPNSDPRWAVNCFGIVNAGTHDVTVDFTGTGGVYGFAGALTDTVKAGDTALYFGNPGWTPPTPTYGNYWFRLIQPSGAATAVPEFHRVKFADMSGTAMTNHPPSGPCTMDTNTLVTGQRVLLGNQPAHRPDEGIWIVNTAGAWTRPSDWASGSTKSAGEVVAVGADGFRMWSSIWILEFDTVVDTNNCFFDCVAAADMIGFDWRTDVNRPIPYVGGMDWIGPTTDPAINFRVYADPGTGLLRRSSLGTFRPGNVVANYQTGSYTLVLTDLNKVVEIDSGSANNLTIPPNSSVAFQVGDTIEACQIGAGQTTIVPGLGVTILPNTRLKIAEQGGSCTLRQRAIDQWVIAGDLTA